MGFLNRAKAIANEASGAGKRAADVVVEQVEGLASQNSRVGKVLTDAKEIAVKSRETVREKTEDISKTGSGQAAGNAVRKIGGVTSSLPVLSAAVDVVRAKNCVDILLDKFRANPDDPYCNIWLAESLIKTSQEIKKYQFAKGVFDPTSLIVAGALRRTAQFGKDSLPSDEKLLRLAWARSVESLRASPRNSASIDVLARVYLAKGDAERAVTAAQAAVVADHSDPMPRITLGRALLRLRAADEAQRAGMSAVTRGSTVGYLIAANAIQLQNRENRQASLIARSEGYENLVARATEIDRARYSGAYRDARQVAAMVKEIQADKAGKTLATMKRLGGIIRDA